MFSSVQFCAYWYLSCIVLLSLSLLNIIDIHVIICELNTYAKILLCITYNMGMAGPSLIMPVRT